MLLCLWPLQIRTILLATSRCNYFHSKHSQISCAAQSDADHEMIQIPFSSQDLASSGHELIDLPLYPLSPLRRYIEMTMSNKRRLLQPLKLLTVCLKNRGDEEIVVL